MQVTHRYGIIRRVRQRTLSNTLNVFHVSPSRPDSAVREPINTILFAQIVVVCHSGENEACGKNCGGKMTCYEWHRAKSGVGQSLSHTELGGESGMEGDAGGEEAGDLGVRRFCTRTRRGGGGCLYS